MRRLTLLAALWLVLGPAFAADWPTRPIRVVIPFPPGGNVDTFARVLYRAVEQEIGQSIVLDNRGGANGIVGAEIVKNSAPDGYTFLNTSFAFAVNPAIRKKMPFDVRKDFTPVTMVALGTGYLVVAHNGFPAKSLKELIELGKRQQIRYSTAGVGNGQHLAGALLGEKAGIKMLHVPYKGGGPALNAVMGGEVNIHFPAPSVGIPQAKAGRVRALAFTGSKPLAAMPDVPLVSTAVPGYSSDAGWHGVFGPANMPPDVAAKFQQAIARALKKQNVHDHFSNNGYDPRGMPPSEWSKLFAEDLKRYREVTRIAGIEPF